MRPVIWCGGKCSSSFGINGIGWKVFFLRNSTQYSKQSIRSRCVCACTAAPLLPRHHTITIPPPPDSPPSLYSPFYLTTSFITSTVSVRERWSDLCLCLFCVCGPSAAWLQHQVSVLVCVGGWEKMKGLWMAFHVKPFFFKWFVNEYWMNDSSFYRFLP